ncbi:CoA transferase, partial [Burkholderia territorii]
SAGRPVDTHTALLPLTLGGERLRLRAAPPALGQDTCVLLGELGYTPDEARALIEAGVVAGRHGQGADGQPPGAPVDTPSPNEVASA